MPPRKRKEAPQAKLEELVDEDVKVLKSKTGHLDEPEVKTKQEGYAAASKDEDGEEDMFAKRRAKKMGAESPPKKKQAAAAATGPAENPPSTSDSGIWVNRAPVLTLWVSIVAQQEGFSKEAGKAPAKPAGSPCNAHGSRQHCHAVSRPACKEPPTRLYAHAIACPGCSILS